MTIPFGPVILVAYLPYAQWRLYAGIHSIFEAHRASLLLGTFMLIFMILMRWCFGKWQQGGLLGALIAAFIAWMIPNSYFLSIIILGLVVLPILIERTIVYDKTIIAVNVLSVVMLGSLLPLAWETAVKRKIIETSTPIIKSVFLADHPSIIHIVMDGYGAPNILHNLYGHDTTPFRTALSQRGFVIMEDTRTPFNQTLPIMASIMSGGEVILPEKETNIFQYRLDLGYTVRNGPVSKIFERAGYTFSSARNGYAYLDFPETINTSNSRFLMTGLEASMSSFWEGRVVDLHNQMLKTALAPGTLQMLPQPFFYYQHLLAPHPPFTLNADGTERSSISTSIEDGSHFVRGSNARRAEYVAGYHQKAIFVENALIRQFDGLPDGPKVVIIHGDHGPGSYMDYENSASSCMAERMTTFMAIYSNIPHVKETFKKQSDKPFNLVNLYRLLLSSISNSDFTMLPSNPKFLKWSDPSTAIAVLPEMLQAPCLSNNRMMRIN